jgi:hypothetical protein
VKRFRKVLPLVVIAAIAMGIVAWLARSSDHGSPLPEGKVAPVIGGRLLLAPDGTFWKFDPPGPASSSLTFTRFAPGNDWASISGSEGGGFALKEDGSLWQWLVRWPGGRTVPILDPPTQVGADRDWAQVEAGWNCALLRKKDDSIWFLGGRFRNSNEGLEPLQPGMEPVQVGADRDWVDIASAILVHYALKRDGTLWRWGNLVYRGPYEPEPKQFDSATDWASITSGGFHFCALKQDRSLWIAGANVHIVIPEAAATGSRTGIYRANGDTDWTQVALGDNAFDARKTDGSWWASGENHYSHLGFRHWFGESKHVAHPQRIPLSLDPWAWYVGENTTLILTRDGRFYYMGKRPGSARTPGGIATIKDSINQTLRRAGIGLPALFARPGEDWSRTPVRVGELPASVTANLKAGASGIKEGAAAGER